MFYLFLDVSKSQQFFPIWILIVHIYHIWETSRKSILLLKIVLTFHCLNKLQILGLQPGISKVFLDFKNNFSHSRSEQFWQQNTKFSSDVAIRIFFLTLHGFTNETQCIHFSVDGIFLLLDFSIVGAFLSWKIPFQALLFLIDPVLTKLMISAKLCIFEFFVRCNTFFLIKFVLFKTV